MDASNASSSPEKLSLIIIISMKYLLRIPFIAYYLKYNCFYRLEFPQQQLHNFLDEFPQLTQITRTFYFKANPAPVTTSHTVST